MSAQSEGLRRYWQKRANYLDGKAAGVIEVMSIIDPECEVFDLIVEMHRKIKDQAELARRTAAEQP